MGGFIRHWVLVLSVAVLTVMALDLERIHQARIPASAQHKRNSHIRPATGADETNSLERGHNPNYAKLLSARMAQLLANILPPIPAEDRIMYSDTAFNPDLISPRVITGPRMGEYEPGYPEGSLYGIPASGVLNNPSIWSENDDLGKRRPLYRTHKIPTSSNSFQESDLLRQKKTLLKPLNKVNLTSSQVSQGAGKPLHRASIMKRSSSSNKEVIKELRNIFHGPSKPATTRTKRNKREEEFAMSSMPEASSKQQNKTAQTASATEAPQQEDSNDNFKKWLMNEYYRNMAMSFASMRRKRSASGSKSAEVAPLEHIKAIEENMLNEALSLVQEGAEDENRMKALSARVADRLDVAYDLEGVRQGLERLYKDAKNLQNDDQISNDINADLAVATLWKPEVPSESRCPELALMTTQCGALEGLFPPVPLQERFMSSCNWHEVCYTCGSVYGMSLNDCDDAFLGDMQQLCSETASCDKVTLKLLLAPLHKKRVFFAKRSAPPVCQRPCVHSFLRDQ